jgi:DMSO/TMAO reductase YedYZ heme-binding membrane subunit
MALIAVLAVLNVKASSSFTTLFALVVLCLGCAIVIEAGSLACTLLTAVRRR